MRAREVVREITRRGGYFTRQVGSHARYRAEYTKPDGTTGQVDTAVAMHPRDIPIGTLRRIEKDLEPAFGRGWLR
ncbi:MAG: addiction module toxin, HicA family [Micromonosporaceae bacterium]|nr:addiction module toxin, HicA family [Micromonosporaceae bacterium]